MQKMCACIMVKKNDQFINYDVSCIRFMYLIRGLFYAIVFIISGVLSLELVAYGQTTPDPALSRQLRDEIEKLTKELAKEKTEIFLSVYRTPDFQEVFSKGADVLLHAASVQKLFITYAALRLLGAEYTIPTEFFSEYLPQERDPRLDPSVGLAQRRQAPADSLGKLYVRAYGNPTFQYEDMLLAARELKARGVNAVTDIVIDDSLFIEDGASTGSIISPGSEAYQAAQSSTVVEFNTYRVQVVPSASGQPALVTTSPGLYGEIKNRSRSLSGKGESLELVQNPPNDLFQKFVKEGVLTPQPLSLQINGRIGLLHPYWEKYQAHPDPFQYYALSLRKAFITEGVSVRGALRRGKVPAEAHSLYVHESEPLYSILAKLNRYSSNFIAGQLLYLIGQDSKGFFSSAKGLENMRELLREINAYPEGSVLADASGLSKDNRISMNQVVNLLNEVEKDFSVSPVFVSSLSRFGLSGTLKNRKLDKDEFVPATKSSVFRHDEIKKQALWAKTGTVEGVSGLSGYVDRFEGFRLVFALVIKGEIEKSRAIGIENDIIKIMLGSRN